jgi:NADPH:quinone reductase-like Zn-dependent oxidoreductase
MKAAAASKYGSPDVIEIKNLPQPIPKDNEVLIRIYAAVVGSTDPVFLKGEPFISRFFSGLTRPKNISGDVFAGEIEDIGKNVTIFKKGDEVFGATDINMGAHAEYRCLPETGAIGLKPENMSYEEAAPVCDGGLISFHFLKTKGNIQTGQKVLINGASGSLGTYGVQLAKYFGAEVTGVCSSSNVEMVKSIGADYVIDYTQEDFTKSGKKYDIIYDAVGKSSYSRCKNSLTENGIYLITTPSPSAFISMLLGSKSKGKRAVFAAGGLKPAGEKAKDLIALKEIAEAGKLKSVIDKRYPLEEIAEAFRYVEKGHKKGNVVISIK